MSRDYIAQVRTLSFQKALAVASYGESVASYRYRTLTEKASSDAQRAIFSEMADEEQDHHARLAALEKQHFPDSDFVLSAQDKQLVIVGPRLLDVTGGSGLSRALEMICESEQLTGKFYATLRDFLTPSQQTFRMLFTEMANECMEHADRIAEMRQPD